MKIKTYILLIYSFTGIAQNTVFYQSPNSYATVGSKTSVYVKGNYETYGKIHNGGKIYITGDIINHSAEDKVFGTTGTVILTDSNAQEIKGEKKTTFNHLVLDKSDNLVTLRQSIMVDSTLNLVQGNMDIDSSTVTFRDYVGRLLNETDDHRVYSNSTGKLIAKVLLDPSQSNKNLAGLGLVVEAPTFSMGITYLERGHYAFSDAGKGSIRRFYNFYPSIPATTVGDIKSVKLAYRNDEVIGMDESALEVFQKDNFKGTWLSKGGKADVALDTLSSDAVYIIPSASNTFTGAMQSKVSSCGTKDVNYVNVKYLVASEAFEGDTIQFVNLSTSNQKITKNNWVFGDGAEDNKEDVQHIYTKESTYQTSLKVSNAQCNNFMTKNITIRPDARRKELQEVVGRIFIIPIGYYPNPTSDYLYFNTELNMGYGSSLSLVDQLGKSHFHKEFSKAQIREVLDLSSLVSGLYLLRFVVMEKSYTYKIVKN